MVLLATPTWAGTAFVQSKSFLAPSGTATSVSVTFTSNVTAGNLIAVSVTYASAASVSSIMDTLGNTYTLVDTATDPAPDNQKMDTAYAKNIAGGACTVTVNFSAAVDFRGVEVHEISGADTVAPLDGHAINFQAAPGTAADAVTSAAVTTTANGDYIFGANWDTAGGCVVITAGTGYTSREATGCTNFTKGLTEDKIQASAGSVAATFTYGTDNATITAIMAFKPAGGAAPQPKRLPVLGIGTLSVPGPGPTASVSVSVNGELGLDMAALSTYPGCKPGQGCLPGLLLCTDTAPVRCIDLWYGKQTLTVRLIRSTSAGVAAYPVGSLSFTLPAVP